MIKFIKAIGMVWAIIGFGNIFLMEWTKSSQAFITFGLIFNMVLFILPGFVVYAICGSRNKGEPT